VKRLEQGGSLDEGVLHDLRHAARVLPHRKGVERVGVGTDHLRLVEGPDEVFARVVVDGGLSSDGCVDLGEEGGG